VKVNGIDAVYYTVKDVDRETEFYTEFSARNRKCAGRGD